MVLIKMITNTRLTGVAFHAFTFKQVNQCNDHQRKLDNCKGIKKGSMFVIVFSSSKAAWSLSSNSGPLFS